ncbi:MAG: FkbM family methyltransferase [Phycisphaerales bacterium]|nr:FkbM family methyltransferase [Phycisphaerales bacterium]
MKPNPAQPQQQFVTQQNLHSFAGEISELFTTLRQRIYAVDARLRLMDEGKTPRFRIEFRSQFGEDLWAYDLFAGQSSGFYIEVGAFDGYNLSVTYALEAMGWNGLLIEALPERYEKCKLRRPNSRVVHSALGKKNASGTVDFVNVSDQYGGMLSFIDAKTEHAKQIEQSKFQTTKLTVPITSMDELLKDHKGPIDLAVIDVEGAELDVLDGFDLYKHKPRALILEENTGGRDQRLMNYMKTKPYVFAGYHGVNQFWVRTDEEKLLNNLRKYDRPS